jgi:hypothetical protein
MLFAFGTAALSLHVMLQAVSGAAADVAPPKTPHDRLAAASQASSLSDNDLKPWHLRLEVTLYDTAGKNPQPGIIETWHSGKQARTVYTFGAAKRTLLGSDDDSYQSTEGPEVPALADYVLAEFLDPGPSLKDIEVSKPEMQSEAFGKTKLDCIMLTESIHHENPFPIGLFPTYCLDPGTTQIRAAYNFGSHTLLRNGLGKFQGREVATHISFMQGDVLLADAKASAFSTFAPEPDTFNPEPALKEVHSSSARIGGGVVAGSILSKTKPIYPDYAKHNHIGGTVVMRALIGRDGRIYYLRPVTAPDSSLAVAAIQAVRLWTYKQYLLNGMPVSIDTTITVNFNLNAF